MKFIPYGIFAFLFGFMSSKLYHFILDSQGAEKNSGFYFGLALYGLPALFCAYMLYKDLKETFNEKK
jgi:TM2 domain-containing membrane protein YozV